MNPTEKIRYKEISKLIGKSEFKKIGDFGSANQRMKKFLKKGIAYFSYDYPKYNFEERFEVKEYFDCAISSEVIEHLRNPRNFLDSLSKSMKKGSQLILTTPNSAFIKNRIELLFGKTPETFFGPSYKEALFSKKYSTFSKDEKINTDFQLHMRAYNYKELKRLLLVSGFRIDKRFKSRSPGIRGFILSLLPLDLQGVHFIIATLEK